MTEVRKAMAEIVTSDIDLAGASLYVDLRGRVFLRRRGRVESLRHQVVAEPVVIDVLSEFRVAGDSVGPDLVHPRPLLRILPGKLAGEPHVEGTRLRTRDIDALVVRGYTRTQIVQMFPFLTERAIEESRDLEQQLRGNLRPKAA